MLQTTKEIQNEEEEKNREYLETSTQYYTEEVKSSNDIENEGKKEFAYWNNWCQQKYDCGW